MVQHLKLNVVVPVCIENKMSYIYKEISVFKSKVTASILKADIMRFYHSPDEILK